METWVNHTLPLATGNGVFVFDESPCSSCLLVVTVAVGARCSNLRNNAATLVLPVNLSSNEARKRELLFNYCLIHSMQVTVGHLRLSDVT